MAINTFALARDFGGGNALIRSAPEYVNSLAVTAAGAAESFTVPAGADIVIFSSDGNFYANCATTATVPGDVTDGTASELNPTGYMLRDFSGGAITAISVISPTSGASVITAAFYRLAKT